MWETSEVTKISAWRINAISKKERRDLWNKESDKDIAWNSHGENACVTKDIEVDRLEFGVYGNVAWKFIC